MAADPPISFSRVHQQVSACVEPRHSEANYLFQFWG